MNKRFFKTHNILPSKHTLQPYSILSTTIKSEMVQCFIENRKKKSHDIVCCFFVDIQNLVIKICSLFIPCFKSGVEEKLSRQSGLAVKIIRGGPWRRKPKKSQPGYQRGTKQCGEETLKSATLKTLVRVIDFTV